MSRKQALDNETKQTIMQNMREFRAMNSFQNGVVALIASLAAQEKELTKLKNMFRDLDQDRNGTLNKQEVKNAFQTLKNELSTSKNIILGSWSEYDYDQLWESMDRDGDGEISYEEFIAAAIDKAALLTNENVDRTFRLIDLDGNGQLSREELEQAFSSNN
jgi:calcium-dependent protein kinase